MTIVNERAPEPQRTHMSVTTGVKPFTSGIPVPAPAPATEIARQPDSIETPSAEVPQKDEQLSPKFAELARREKALLARHRKIQEESAALEAKKSEYQTNYVPKNQLKDLIVKDPTALGLSQDELLNLALNGPTQQNQETAALHTRIQQLEEKLEQTVTKADARTTEAYQQAVNDIRRNVKILVDSDTENKFEAIKAEENGFDIVTDLITETYEKEKILLTEEEAAQRVEDYLIEEFVKRARLKKVQAKLAPPVEQAPTPAPQEKTGIKTLTNAQNASMPGRLTEKERRERAVLAFRGQLPN